MPGQVQMPQLRLFHYWRSSSSWRVRWALDYKEIACELQAVSLLNGESESDEHRARNPLGYVPVLERLDLHDSSRFLSQSTAIAEWLDEVHPTPPLFWGDAWTRAKIRSLSEMISADTQPIQNLNVLQRHSNDPAEQKKWAQEFIAQGLNAFERAASFTAGKFSVGDELSWADLCLIPQCYNAARFDVPLDTTPIIRRIRDACESLESCKSSHPGQYEPKP